MGQQIHCKKTNKGLRFRLWSTCSDRYIGPDMDEAELTSYLREQALLDALRDFERGFPERLERAKGKGTSCGIDPGEDGPMTKWRGEK